MNPDRLESLSKAGGRRRDQMLGELTAAMRVLHTRRRTRRRAILVTGLALVATSALALALLQPTGPEPTLASPATTKIVIVRTDPTVLDRYAVRPLASTIIIDDDMLLTTLAQIERPAGLVRAHDRAWLTREVADDPAGG
jgi:hypothetical protein